MADIYFENLPSTSTPIKAENLNKLNDVKVSTTEPITGEKVWIKKGKNLLNKDTIFRGYIETSSQKIVTAQDEFYSCYAKVTPNTTYTVSKQAGKSFRIATTNIVPIDGVTYTSTTTNHTGTSITITTGVNDNYICIFFYATSNGDTGGYSAMANSIQVEQGSTATTYEAYIEPEIYSKNNNNVYEKLLLGKDIVESGSNYIKYADGTMICYRSVSITATITTAWGSWYETADKVNFGDFAVAFQGTPVVTIQPVGTACWVEALNSTSATNIGNAYLARPISSSSASYTFYVIAIGRWK